MRVQFVDRVLWVCRGFTQVAVLFFCAPALLYASSDTQNLLMNGSFEDGVIERGLVSPRAWKKDGWELDEENTQFNIELDTGVTGHAVSIHNKVAAHSYFSQEVLLEAGAKYKLSGWIKSEGVGPKSTGANIGIANRLEHTDDLRAHQDWQERALYIKTGSENKVATVLLSLGHYGRLNMGTAYFDNLILEKIDTIPSNGKVIFFSDAEAAKEKEEEKKAEAKARAPYYSTPPSGIIMMIIFTAFALLVLAGYLIYYCERYKKGD